MKISPAGLGQITQMPPKKMEAPAEIPAEVPTGQTRVPGVVRLINEGHFKPTADIRLRLNFSNYLDPVTPTPQENVKGKAYAKFLARYQELLPPPATEPPPVDETEPPVEPQPLPDLDVTA